jgi:hypothetical protein
LAAAAVKTFLVLVCSKLSDKQDTLNLEGLKYYSLDDGLGYFKPKYGFYELYVAYYNDANV